jgi:hypothetical protein
VLGFTYNFNNTARQYQNGVDMHFDWGSSQFLSKQVIRDELAPALLLRELWP